MTDSKDRGTALLCFEVPEVSESHYARARVLANMVWQLAEVGDRDPVSTACLTAALLFKRAAVRLKIPHDVVQGMAALYLGIVHEIIQQRRAAVGRHDN